VKTPESCATPPEGRRDVRGGRRPTSIAGAIATENERPVEACLGTPAPNQIMGSEVAYTQGSTVSEPIRPIRTALINPASRWNIVEVLRSCRCSPGGKGCAGTKLSAKGQSPWHVEAAIVPERAGGAVVSDVSAEGGKAIPH